jgi:hypothetical protein
LSPPVIADFFDQRLLSREAAIHDRKFGFPCPNGCSTAPSCHLSKALE